MTYLLFRRYLTSCANGASPDEIIMQELTAKPAWRVSRIRVERPVGHSNISLHIEAHPRLANTLADYLLYRGLLFYLQDNDQAQWQP